MVNNRRVTALRVEVLADLVAEIGPLWDAQRQAGLLARPRRRRIGAGARHKLVFVDRLLATLIHLRHGVTHDVLGWWFGVDRSTITRAVGQIRPLLAQRGCRIAPGRRLTTLADVIAYLGDGDQTAILDATEIRVRRPAAGTVERDRFVSGRSRINAMKVMVLTDARGTVLYCGQVCAGSVADITQARRSGLVELLSATRGVEILADAGYQGLDSQTGGQVATPLRKRRGKHLDDVRWLMAHHDAARHAHAARRRPVKHGIAHLRTGEPWPVTTVAATSCPRSSRPSPDSCPINRPRKGA
ncbi:transposase, partial [Nonomuraea sp. RK-328]|nr:transposase [Nonomuraea sp. RK-328]